jgi:signal transduction histidine kinase
MISRRSLTLPIVLAVVMVALVAVLTVGWILQAALGAQADREFAGRHWAFLAIGTSFLGLLLIGVILYLVFSVKAINLTRRQSNFIDSVTHELKSPIASMKLHLQTLSRRRVGEEKREAFYERMLGDLERLDHLINHVLDAGRAEAGRSRRDEEEISLSEVIRDCAETSRRRHRAPEDAVRLALEPGAIRARRTDVEIIFRNLLDNALKYAGEPPRVEVDLRVAPRGVAVASIADNGRGVPARKKRSIFGRFVRLGSELTRERAGTGLGLYIARWTVRRLRGRIRVRDRQPEPGAVFVVELPGVIARSSAETGDAGGESGS